MPVSLRLRISCFSSRAALTDACLGRVRRFAVFLGGDGFLFGDFLPLAAFLAFLGTLREAALFLLPLVFDFADLLLVFFFAAIAAVYHFAAMNSLLRSFSPQGHREDLFKKREQNFLLVFSVSLWFEFK